MNTTDFGDEEKFRHNLNFLVKPKQNFEIFEGKKKDFEMFLDLSFKVFLIENEFENHTEINFG
jgi:hypothetical protein